MRIPILRPDSRVREYNIYSYEFRDKIIYSWLFLDKYGHRDLDRLILNLDPKYSKGFQSMGILHHLGIKKEHKAIFKDLTIDVAIQSMLEQDEEGFKKIIESLKRYNDWNLYEEIKLDIDSEEAENNSEFSSSSYENRAEGKLKYYYGKKYERDPKNRAAAIMYHGTVCKICGFNFEAYYGSRGRGYIEIHHIHPLNTIGKEVIIDPKKDLIPVCSNCHRMIHRRMDYVLSIEGMIELVNNSRII